ncbi:hypothetical protein TYRP_006705 [Tyrophagus putrescentiae]|nr:hypothetical protein TYRP_006705 [Tyrophagus putrescentiae]
MSCGLQQQHSRSRQHSIIVSRQHSRIQHISTLIDVQKKKKSTSMATRRTRLVAFQGTGELAYYSK